MLALALVAGPIPANADSLNGSWQTWSSTNLAVDGNSPTVGTPYWNNASGDGPKDNVGWCIAGGGTCSMAAGPQGLLPYNGNATTSLAQMYFTSTGNPITVDVQTLMTTQTTTASGYDVVGYYLAGSSGSAPSTSSLVELFDSRSASLSSTQTITSLTAGQNYGFYIENIQGSGTPFATDYYFFMDSASNISTGSMPADSLQHFAVFNGGNGNYFLGDVDTDACQGSYQPGASPCNPSSEFDYNDFMLEVSTSAASSTPEPASFALLAGGLLALGLLRRKNRSKLEN